MSSASKGKPKADPTGPSIRVEETVSTSFRSFIQFHGPNLHQPHELSREERPFRLKRKERLQDLSPIQPSLSRAASRGPFESEKSQSTSEETSGQAPQDLVQGSKRDVQVMGAIGGGVFRENLDKGKGRDNERFHEAGGLEFLASMPGHPRQDYDNSGSPKADDRERYRDQLAGVGVPSSQEITHVLSHDVASQLHAARHLKL
ncbi:hypothetical protein M378DRAFT_13665 [Amanita muscaria Koide BX008]|uniref:Uncharacterized protein n=1 Tax=Amanita muscaria (strain Koide BX008) TaxID=946122 RepID=A0A0C2T3Z4_AMAMK|nr:hypothetical protein M378DRAFT_13665 [Amanita muscaria Koide BX008]